MAIAFVATTKSTNLGAGGGATAAVDTSGCTLIVLAISRAFAGASTTLSDNQGNSWTQLHTASISTLTLEWYYCLTPTTNAAHTFSFVGTNVYPSVVMTGYSGTGIILGQKILTTSAGGFSQTCGSLTPAWSDSLIVSAHGHIATDGQAVDSGLTERQDNPRVAGQQLGAGIADIIQGAAAAINPSWSSGQTVVRHAAQAVFFEPSSITYLPLIIDEGIVQQIQGGAKLTGAVYAASEFTTDEALVRVNGVSGRGVQQSTATLTDAGLLTTTNVLVGTTCTVGTSTLASITGGTLNDIAGSDYAHIGGGDDNTIDSSLHAFLGGGDTNVISNTATYAVLCGGDTNTVTACTHSAIVGGDLNIVNGCSNSIIGGGASNSITGTSTHCVIAGGYSNQIDTGGVYSQIGGGYDCTISNSNYVGIMGGRDNSITASSTYGVIGGGRNNHIIGSSGCFIAGRDNTINSADNYAALTGYQTVSSNQSERAHGSPRHDSTNGSCQLCEFVLGNTTADATVTTLWTDNNNATVGALTLPPNTAWAFNAIVNGFKTDGSAMGNYELLGSIRRDGAAAATFGTLTKRIIHEDVVGWDATANASGNTLRIRVTGAAATDINWTAVVRAAQVIVES